MLEGFVGWDSFSVASAEFGIPNAKLQSQCAISKSAASLSPEAFLEVVRMVVVREYTADDELPQYGDEVACAELQVAS